MAQTSKRPPITCHVLDTVSGLPASGVPVTLTLLKPNGLLKPLTATTDSDGRVNAWISATDGSSLEEIFANAREQRSASEELALHTGEATGPAGREGKGRGTVMGTGEMVWALSFDVGEYFKGEGFWTEVEVRFKTGGGGSGGGEEGRERSHWHVPLLLSPWSYTTYRGS